MQKIIQAHVVTGQGESLAQIAFDDETGLISAVGDLGVSAGQVDYLYPPECKLFAGMGDVHIHAREDMSGKHCYKEDFVSCAEAGLNGGLVHLSDMPNNPIPPVDEKSYRQKLALTQKAALPYCLYAGVGPQTNPLQQLVPYKVYMGPSVGELFFEDLQQLENTLERYRGCTVSFHCEDPEILQQFTGEKTHFQRRPVQAELLATQSALGLIEKFQLRGKLCHYSIAEGLPLIQQAKAAGLSVQCEVTPQHLYFCQEDIEQGQDQDQAQAQVQGQVHDKGSPADFAQWMQMNPPIRTRAHQKALQAAFLRGDIDFLATDHAPHSPAENAQGISGLPGLDTYALLVSWLLVDLQVPPQIIAKTCSENPGDFFNQFLPTLGQMDTRFQRWGKGFGFLRPGYSASFTIINLHHPLTVTEDLLQTKPRWSPFLGRHFPGRLQDVFVHGKRM